MGISRHEVEEQLLSGEEIVCVVENVAGNISGVNNFSQYPYDSTDIVTAAVTTKRLIVGHTIKEGIEWVSVATIDGFHQRPRQDGGQTWLQVLLGGVHLGSRRGDQAEARALVEFANCAFAFLASASAPSVAAPVAGIEGEDLD